MRDEYDFSKGERGKFYKPNLQLHAPVYLEQSVQDYFLKKATEKGIELSRLINELLKKDIEIIEATK